MTVNLPHGLLLPMQSLRHRSTDLGVRPASDVREEEEDSYARVNTFLSNYAIGLLFLVCISTEDKYSRYELTALGEIQSNTISLNCMFINAAGDSVTEP